MWGFDDGSENIVWGTDDGLENIVWGTDDGLENIVWGTDDGRENIVWGTDAGSANIVWGTDGSENIVWGTALRRRRAMPRLAPNSPNLPYEWFLDPAHDAQWMRHEFGDTFLKRPTWRR